ncbi:outer membrane protein, OMP85 family [Xylaria sp. CBS 124048]|nr:outer membrane protein, OMP85 family [Xylaria sp. CBS 124048]
MAQASGPEDDDVFASLLKKETSSVEQRSASAAHIQESDSEQRMVQLLSQNQTLPVTLTNIQVHGAKNTRKSFLSPLFQPLVEGGRNADYTLNQLLNEVGNAVAKMQRFDIFHPDVMVHLAQPPFADPSTSPTPLEVALRVREKSRLVLKTGTDLGNTEGSAYATMLMRNMFGGAELLSVNASTGTRTRSAYSAEFSTPLQGNPNLRLSIDGLASSTHKPWASHEEVLKGSGLKLNWARENGDRFQLGYSGTWRQLTGLSATASPTIRGDAGDSVKSAISYSFQRERRDNPMLPQNGYMIKSTTELAGWGFLGGDVGFSKTEIEATGAIPVPIPGLKGPSGISIGCGLRAGLLYPLPLSFGLDGALPSRVNDRFTLGGPTDVRGFSLGGLGPRDGTDALGGDAFIASGVNMLIPFPRTSPDSPFRIQLFANGGRSVAMKNTGKRRDAASGQGMTAASVLDGMLSATKEAGTGLPSISAGFGVVYAHSVARFELNFSLPLVTRMGEESRKGLQVGIGINFL